MSFPSALAANPLVNPPALPHGAPAFDKIRIEHFEPAYDWALDKARAEIAAIRDNPATPTFANTIEAIAFAGEDFSRVAKLFSHFVATMANQTVRDTQAKLDPLATKYYDDFNLDAGLFARVEQVYNSAEGQNLQGSQAMLLEKIYEGFVRAGALLDEDNKKTLRALNEKLKDLTSKYQNNIVEAEGEYKFWIDDAADLDGLPQSSIDTLAKNAEDAGQPGKWLVTSGYETSLFKYCRNFALTEKLFKEITTLNDAGKYDNGPLVLDILKMRHEKALLLGKANWAEVMLQDTMALNVDTVMKFEEQALAAYRPAAAVEYKKITDLAASEGVPDLKPWQVSYFTRILQEKTFSVKMEDVKSYFDLNKIIASAEQHEKKFFGYEMVPAADKYPVWHPDVRVDEVRKDGKTIAILYSDYFIRQDEKEGQKRSGAWMDELRTRGLHNGVDEIPIIVNCYDYEEPPAGKPPLVPMRDGSTTYHERGHGSQGITAVGPYAMLNGTNVSRDAVELASQFMENYYRAREVIKTFAINEQGQAIPDDLLNKIEAMNNFNAGLGGQRQVFLGLLDMKFHTTDPARFKTAADLYAFEDHIRADCGIPPRGAGAMFTGFHHLFGDPEGYSSSYYSYKWSEGLEADAFISGFQKLGDLYNAQAAGRYTEMIASGSNKPMDVLYRDFMGRDPDWNPLFERQGHNRPEKPAGRTFRTLIKAGFSFFHKKAPKAAYAQLFMLTGAAFCL